MSARWTAPDRQAPSFEYIRPIPDRLDVGTFYKAWPEVGPVSASALRLLKLLRIGARRITGEPAIPAIDDAYSARRRLVLLPPARGARAAAAPRTHDQPPVTFRVEVNYVEIDAVVTDAQGNFVRDLTKERLRGPRGRQAADALGAVARRHPGRAARRAAVRADADRAGCPQQPASEFNGRVFVLVLDDLNTHFARGRRVSAAARQFIETLSRRERHRRGRADRRLAEGRAGVHQQPAAAAAGDRHLHGAEDPLRHAGQDRRLLHAARDAGPRPDAARPERGRARATRRATPCRAAPGRRLPRRRARPAQGGAVLQRRHRLRRQQPDSEPLRVRPARRNAAKRLPRRRAPTSASTASIRAASAAWATRRWRSRRCPPIRRSASARPSLNDELRCRRTACARSPTRPAASRRSTATTSRTRSPGSSRTTAATTCSAITRTTPGGTAVSAA